LLWEISNNNRWKIILNNQTKNIKLTI